MLVSTVWGALLEVAPWLVIFERVRDRLLGGHLAALVPSSLGVGGVELLLCSGAGRCRAASDPCGWSATASLTQGD